MTRETELREALANRWRAEADAIDASLAVLRRVEAAGSESARLLLHGKNERQLRAMMRRDTLLECAAALAALAIEPEQGDVGDVDERLAQAIDGLVRKAGAPLRDDTRGPTRGEQIIRENAEIAGSNPATALFPPRDDTP